MRRKRVGMRWKIFILLMLLVAGGGAEAALSARGATDLAHGGFPVWYQDAGGLSLQICVDQNGFCLGADTPDAHYTPAQPVAFPSNWPGEAFYFTADSTPAFTVNGDSALVVMALEATYASLDPFGEVLPTDGQQTIFQRLRVKIMNPPLTGTYTIDHPWGSEPFGCTAGVICVFTKDVPAGGTGDGNFDGALAGYIGPFLRASLTVGGAPVPPLDGPGGGKYIASPVSPTHVTGGPIRNIVQIKDPLGVVVGTEDFFLMSGKLVSVQVSPTTFAFPAQLPTIASAPQIFTVTNIDAVNPMTLGTIAITGTDAADFTLAADTCSGVTLPVAPSSCTFSVIFNGAAAATAARTAQITIPATAPANMPSGIVALSGVIDSIAPTVTITEPADAATLVPINQAITITFSETMNPATINATNFSLSGGITGNVTFDAVNHIATFTPAASLPVNTAITATVGTGVTDMVGNPMATARAFTFTTGDFANTTAPTVTVTSPLNNTTGIALDAAITATFNKPMDSTTLTSQNFILAPQATGAAVTAAVTYDAATKMATLTPDNILEENTVYEARVTNNVVDAFGNQLAADVTWTFLTDVKPTAPVLTMPTDTTTGIGTSVNLEWMSSSDQDGDDITYHVYYCKNGFFLGCAPVDQTQTAALELGRSLWARFGLSGVGLMLGGLFFVGGIRGRQKLMVLLAVSLVSWGLATACGSDGGAGTASGAAAGGGGANPTTNPVPMTLTVNGLEKNVTYFWKVEADDGRAGKTSSATWKFTTAP